ncbi:nondiscriminating glutamyl-tRNA synthetase [Bacilli bacterium PM5-3]|nr:nondiscriminating glutamyl-tRNA synthetase [Bacilli bacterium PM5-3]MDH6603316.1 nondiscriminating glutamyl-tRNA synthetase [Bacilli bacterium PM5-9]
MIKEKDNNIGKEQNMKKVRVRYAPSPTGHLHIGGARTALFNYLFAKHYNGDFIFRLEDTDIERNIPNGEASQLDNLEWLGIIPDESPINPGDYGPYRQTERLDIYQDYAKKLVEAGLAYECYCTPEELDESRKQQEKEGQFSFRYARTCCDLTQEQKDKYKEEGRTPSIRFKVDENAVYKWHDIVRGDIEVVGKDISDWVIIKSNGIATYNFGVTIDDALMKISHVFRGEEHISNTPKQIMVYDALGLEKPEFGHLTLIVNEDRKKLSKRDETIMQFVSQYKEEGYLPEALFNFFSLLGWSPEGEEEIFTKSEIIEMFDENRLSKSPSMFDKKKLYWINNHYIKNTDIEKIEAMCMEFLNEAYPMDKKSKEWSRKLIELFKPQLNYCKEIVELVNPFFEEFNLTKEDIDFLNELEAKDLLLAIKEEFSKMETFEAVEIKEVISKVGKEMSRKGKQLFMPVRLAVSCKRSGGDLPTVVELYGKELAIENIEKTIGMM